MIVMVIIEIFIINNYEFWRDDEMWKSRSYFQKREPFYNVLRDTQLKFKLRFSKEESSQHSQ